MSGRSRQGRDDGGSLAPDAVPAPPRAAWPAGSRTSLIVLAVLASLAALHAARPVLLPLVVAVLASLILRPLVKALGRARIPPSVGAALVLILFVTVTVLGLVRLYHPAMEWVSNAPASLRQVEKEVGKLLRPVADVSRAARQVERMTTVPDGSKTQEVELKTPSFMDSLLTNMRAFVASALVVVVLVYLLLAFEGVLVRKAAELWKGPRAQEGIHRGLASAQRQMTRYLTTTCLINAGEGLVVGLALWGLSIPNPLLWGVMATVANFVPYLGALTAMAVLFIVSLLTFESLALALAPPIVYLIVNTLEMQVVTPLVMGKRFAIHPVVVFVSVVFWGWLWGVPGALLAIPLLTLTKILLSSMAPESRLTKLLQP